ncbi:sensor histidine kinase [Streptomyces chrestomyceticus]|uniref:sensor histidine kinase n=1 Tax=Streptomyces chrestomyceticus TaxID=68185 RepID=UPI00379C3B01
MTAARSDDGVRTGRWKVRPGAIALAVAGLPLSLLGTAYVLVVLYAGGLLSLTLIGLPLLAVGLRGARYLGRAHAWLIRVLLGETVDAPAPPVATTGVVRWIRAGLSDVTAWRSLLYLLLRLPVDALTFVVTIALPAFGVWCGVWALASGQAPWVAAVAVLGGLAVLLSASVAARAMLNAQRLLARTLLGPSSAQLRVRALERARSTALTEGDRSLRQVERDLHDGTQAQLVAIAMTLSMTADALDGEPSHERLRTLVGRARTQADAAIAELRRLIDGISPAALDRGLLDALPQLTSQAGVPVALRVNVPRRPDPVIERVAYFCVAELLTNISKHSGATQASVDADLVGQLLRIRVHDNGCGGAQLQSGSGLLGLAERLAAVDGTLSLDSPPSGPTTVVLDMPVRI